MAGGLGEAQAQGWGRIPDATWGQDMRTEIVHPNVLEYGAEVTPYSVLGVSRTATRDEIHTAYLGEVKSLDPSAPDYISRFQLANWANSVFKDEVAVAQLNAHLAAQASTANTSATAPVTVTYENKPQKDDPIKPTSFNSAYFAPGAFSTSFFNLGGYPFYYRTAKDDSFSATQPFIIAGEEKTAVLELKEPVKPVYTQENVFAVINQLDSHHKMLISLQILMMGLFGPVNWEMFGRMSEDLLREQIFLRAISRALAKHRFQQAEL